MKDDIIPQRQRPVPQRPVQVILETHSNGGGHLVVTVLISICFSICIVMSFLYYSGILHTSAKNLDEIAYFTHALARITNSFASYLEIFQRLQHHPQFQQFLQETVQETVQKTQFPTPHWCPSFFCPSKA